jgi:hypothetical protein
MSGGVAVAAALTGCVIADFAHMGVKLPFVGPSITDVASLADPLLAYHLSMR